MESSKTNALCLITESAYSFERQVTLLVSLDHHNKIPQPVWLKQQTFISDSSGSWEVQDQDAGQFGFCGHLFFWPADSHLLAVPSHGLSSGVRTESDHSLSLPLLVRPLMLSWGPRHHDLIWLPWSRPQYHHIGVQGLRIWIWGHANIESRRVTNW